MSQNNISSWFAHPSHLNNHIYIYHLLRSSAVRVRIKSRSELGVAPLEAFWGEWQITQKCFLHNLPRTSSFWISLCMLSLLFSPVLYELESIESSSRKLFVNLWRSSQKCKLVLNYELIWQMYDKVKIRTWKNENSLDYLHINSIMDWMYRAILRILLHTTVAGLLFVRRIVKNVELIDKKENPTHSFH